MSISFCWAQNVDNEFSNAETIKNHLFEITKTKLSRNYKNVETLDSVAAYIYEEFNKYCDTVYYQPYMVNGSVYKNVIGVIAPQIEERIVIGAHYDVAGNQEGADDNASGVVGLLELARLFSKSNQQHRIDLVAYTLEEPPFFRTEKMGSFIHAQSLKDQNSRVKGMICLEMIGFYSDEEDSQKYPVSAMSKLYGTKGNYITVVQKPDNGQFSIEFSRQFQEISKIKTVALKASPNLPGIDLSDHLNYWNFGYSAVMITDTAIYRNHNYHTSSDGMETLDFQKMKAVIDQVYLTVKLL